MSIIHSGLFKDKVSQALTGNEGSIRDSAMITIALIIISYFV